MSTKTQDEVSDRVTRSKKRKRRKYIILGVIVIGLFGTYEIDEVCKNKTVPNVIIDDSRVIEENKAIEDNRVIKNSDYLILINKENHINGDYVPKDLVIPNVRFRVADDMCREMRLDAANALQKMFNDAKNEGINLIAISGYRSYEYQKEVYDKSVATEGQEYTNNYVAIPGTSEHQSGLVMDLLSDEYSSLDEGFENTKAFQWLKENMSNYGFILRYPRGKEDITGYDYEPWHLRYVGVEAAKEIMSQGITLEEYLN